MESVARVSRDMAKFVCHLAYECYIIMLHKDVGLDCVIII